MARAGRTSLLVSTASERGVPSRPPAKRIQRLRVPVVRIGEDKLVLAIVGQKELVRSSFFLVVDLVGRNPVFHGQGAPYHHVARRFPTKLAMISSGKIAAGPCARAPR